MRNLEAAIGLHHGVGIKYKVLVVDKNGKVVRRVRKKKNLILDQGLDLLAANSWVDCIRYAAVGNATNPTTRDSGTTTFTRTGNAVAASANFFEAGDVGRLLKFDSGEEMYVTGYTNQQNVTVNISGTLAASQGTVWYVNDIGLGNELKRTGSFSTDSGDNNTSWTAGQIQNKRTFLFGAESGTVTYTEIGWSNSGTAGNNLFGRDVFTAGVTLVAGQQLKVVLVESVTPSPQATVSVSDVGNNGFVTAGDAVIESIYWSAAAYSTSTVSSVNSDGSTNNGYYKGLGIEPCLIGPPSILLASADFTLSPVTRATVAAPTGTAKNMTLDTYVSGSFTRTAKAVFGTADGNGTVYGLCIVNSSNRCYSVHFTNPQTKDSNHTLTITWRVSWGRVLVN